MTLSKNLFFTLILFQVTCCFSQNLISNSSFELEDTSWKSKGDTMERHHKDILGILPPTGEYYAELANSKGYQLYQEVKVEKGAYYQVSFFAQARPRVSEKESYFVFKVDEQLTADIQPDLGTWNHYTYTVEATSTTMLVSFEDTYYGKGGIGAMVDDVKIEKLEPRFEQIFNAKTLAGWKVYAIPEDIEKNYWAVENGAIVCNTKGSKDHDYVWLFYEEELTDFELKIKFQAHRDSPGNSGIQFRSRFYEGGDIDGPQVDIHPPKPFRTGLIYDETDQYNHWIFPKTESFHIQPEQTSHKSTFYYADDTPSWNKLHIICKGNYVKTILNGTVVADFDGEGILNDKIHTEQNVGVSGKIGLQLHRKNAIHIAFKDIQLKKYK